ncbi:hypothetical protein BV20DRAFT_1057374 [Pilatotrama ljubarskyi]|nr:hypothetical protein BV20DRAFT_1057374 [Pilatotrama ljubarskyi]
MSAAQWVQCLAVDSVDICAWGGRVDDLHVQQRSRLLVSMHQTGAICGCIIGTHPDEVLLIEFSRLLVRTNCRRSANYALTFRNNVAGLNLVFPDEASLEAFHRLAVAPSAVDFVDISTFRLEDVNYVEEEDVTIAYRRSFRGARTYKRCDFLYAGDPPADRQAIRQCALGLRGRLGAASLDGDFETIDAVVLREGSEEVMEADDYHLCERLGSSMTDESDESDEYFSAESEGSPSEVFDSEANLMASLDCVWV